MDNIDKWSHVFVLVILLIYNNNRTGSNSEYIFYLMTFLPRICHPPLSLLKCFYNYNFVLFLVKVIFDDGVTIDRIEGLFLTLPSL